MVKSKLQENVIVTLNDSISKIKSTSDIEVYKQDIFKNNSSCSTETNLNKKKEPVIQYNTNKVKNDMLRIDNTDYYIRNIMGDGNCLFTTISFHVYGTEDRYREIVDYAYQNWNEIDVGENINALRYEGDIMNPYNDVKDYKRRMGQDKEFGTLRELGIASKVFNFEFAIIVHSEDGFKY